MRSLILEISDLSTSNMSEMSDRLKAGGAAHCPVFYFWFDLESR